ncbi:MAG TPA: sucrose-phosphate phosphatase, partial [Candidatus Caenarcaniphilales bacterium]
MAKFLLVTDLDNTLVGDDQALASFNQQLNQHRQAHETLLVYSTGRSLTSYQHLKAEKPLLEPDFLVAAVGTEIYARGSDRPEADWSEKLAQDWDRDLVVATTAHFADLIRQPESEERPFKASYFLTPDAALQVLPELESLLQARGLDVKLVYSSGKDLDILPRHGDKGEAMLFLRETVGMAANRTVVCGDSGNDRALFSAAGEERGIVVGNAQQELLEWHYANPSNNRYLAQAHCAAGILEG